MTIYHSHHIVPRHMGGTDELSNLISLTVEEHAEAHKKLWEEHGNVKDYYAWKGLSSQIGKEEIRQELSRYGAIKRNMMYGSIFSNLSRESIEKRRDTRKKRSEGYNSPEHTQKLVDASRTPEAISKKKMVYKEIGHQQGTKNSQFGTMWITNGTENKKIKREDLDKWTSLGYNKGRVIAP